MKQLLLFAFLLIVVSPTIAQNVKSRRVDTEDVVTLLKEAGYDIFHKETTEQDYDWECYVKCIAPDSDDYIFFYIFDTNEEAVNYADEREWNILLYFFSELFGDSSWLKTKSYNNIAIEYDQNELYVPFESLIN